MTSDELPREHIPMGSDHAGVELKAALREALEARGIVVDDVGAHSAESVDYPDYAHPVANAVSSGAVRRGVLLCGTGLGMSYVANRYPGVRAAVAWTPEIAALARQHNDANILVLPARFVTAEQALAILDAWLDTPYEGGRHDRRVAKIEHGEAGG